MGIPTTDVDVRNLGQRRRVVVIGEDVSRRVELAQALDRVGFEIVEADAPERVDAIVLDLAGVGETTLAGVPELSARAPVIVVLDRDDPELMRRALAVGAAEVLSSNAVISTELVPRVNAAIQRAVAHRTSEARERLLRTELARGQRLQALGVAAASTAHDFNNLLTAILGSVDVLLQGPEGLSPETAPGLRRIRRLPNSPIPSHGSFSRS